MPQACSRCNSTLESSITLICEHELCRPCAEEIKKPEGTAPLDAKFRLICPRCGKNTLTHNVENLINEENDKFLFDNMESSELNESSLGQINQYDSEKPKFTEKELKEMSYSQRFSSIWAERKTPDLTERGSRASNDSKRGNKNSTSRAGSLTQISVQCFLHKENIMFYCEQEKKVMCMECIYKHTKEHKNHKIYQVKEAMGTIEKENQGMKNEAKKRVEEIEKCVVMCKTNKSKIEQAYEIHEELINKEFKELENLIKNKKSETLEYLSKVFEKKNKEINNDLNDYNYLKNCFQEHYEYHIENEYSNLYFFNSYTMMRETVNKGFTKVKPFDKEDLTCFDKLCSANDFKLLLDKFLKPKKDGRESKVQSRGPSEPQNVVQQSKSILFDEYKNAKKNLEKINKLEKEHKINKEKNYNYLNNYVIDIQKKDGQFEKGVVRERKSSIGTYYNNEEKKIIPNKSLTPTRLISSKSRKK